MIHGPSNVKFVLILSSHLDPGLENCLFISGFHTKILYATLTSPKRAICPYHLILLDLIIRKVLGEGYKL